MFNHKKLEEEQQQSAAMSGSSPQPDPSTRRHSPTSAAPALNTVILVDIRWQFASHLGDGSCEDVNTSQEIFICLARLLTIKNDDFVFLW